jgi:hypothetical protein
MDYKKVAKYIGKSEDSGGELVKLLEEIDQELLDKKEGIFIVQAVPEDNKNPIVQITVFTNKQTDFPLDTDELYIKWVKDYANSL